MALSYLASQSQILLRLGDADLSVVQDWILEVAGGGVIPGNLDVTGNITAGGDITATGNVTGANLSGTNTGNVTLAAVGSVPNANGASLSGQVLTLQPASATQPGVVTTGTQSLAGDKTFTGALAASSTLAVTGTSTFSDNISVPSAKYLNLDGTFNNDNGISYNSGTFTTSIRTAGGTSVAINASASTITYGGYKPVYNSTDSTGTPGAATINKPSGKSAVALGASSVQITNSLVTSSSIVLITPLDLQDATLGAVKAVAGNGSFTVTGNANATAAWKFQWVVLN